MSNSKCNFCKKKTFMPSSCKYCEKDLCMKCLLPTKHACPKIELWRCKDSLRDQLLNNKCVSQKIEKI